MTDNSSQLELLTSQPTRYPVEVEESMARGCKSRHHALIKSYEASNLQPKPFYMQVGIDQATFSNICSGKRFPDPDIYFKWMHVAGNLIPFRYDGWKLKHELRPIITGLEAELAEERERRLEAERRNRYLEELVMGRRA